MRREDVADLTMFLAVAEDGSFTAAAKRLGLSQSGLSHSIRRLEDRLGLPLLEDWCQPFDGYYLYYPSRRHSSPAFRLLVEELRWRG